MVHEAWEYINKSILKADMTFKHIEIDLKGKTELDTISKHTDYQKWCFSFVADNECLPFKEN